MIFNFKFNKIKEKKLIICIFVALREYNPLSIYAIALKITFCLIICTNINNKRKLIGDVIRYGKFNRTINC